MTTVSFPGIGIGEFKINPVAFRIGSLEVRWYGIIIVTGIILAFLYCAYRSKQEGISFDDLLDFAIFTVPMAIIGARAYYVLTSLDEYSSFLEMIAIWNGGIAIYGAIIAGAITILVVCRVKKYSLNKMLKFFDSVAPAVMIGQIVGRWGNFCNGEAHGGIIPEDSWLYFIRMGLGNDSIQQFVHPTFLYESLWNLVGFCIIHFLYKKKKFDGQVVLMYLTWYGFGRMLIEGLRTDSLYIGVFRISQVVGFLCFVICGILLIVGLVKAHRKEKDKEAYSYTYKKANPAYVFDAESEGELSVKSDKEDNKTEENSDTKDGE